MSVSALVLTRLAWLLGLEGEQSADGARWWDAIDWLTVLLIAVIVLVLAVAIYAFVVWRRRRAKTQQVEDSGQQTARRLAASARDFYENLPDHVPILPVFIVFGESGAGKSTLIDTHVDWKGESYQLASSPDHKPDDPLQFYLGPDMVVQEVSPGLLRDNSPSTKRALNQIWREIGSTATVVVVLDATTLLDMDVGARRELAQLVRGKIGLMPEQVRANFDVRLYLSKLDLVPGYLDFAALAGSTRPPIELVGAGVVRELEALIDEFDAHLTYALVAVGGQEFDRLLSFYAHLPELVRALRPITDGLTGDADLFSARYFARHLYLGSRVPNSCIGDPFAVEREQIEIGLTRHVQRHRRRALALGTVLTLAVVGLTVWHGRKVLDAEAAVYKLAKEADDDRRHEEESGIAGRGDGDDEEQLYAREVSRSLQDMERSQWLWMRWAFRPTKDYIDNEFEATIYGRYLERRFDNHSRVDLIYLTSVLHATKASELGQLIIANSQQWAQALKLPAWVVTSYVEASHEHRDDYSRLSTNFDNPGKEWEDYLRQLPALFARPYLPPDCFDDLGNTPKLRSADEYRMLNQVRALMRQDGTGWPDNVRELYATELDPWGHEKYAQLSAMSETFRRADIRTPEAATWGLASLVDQLGQVQKRSKKFEIAVGDELVRSTDFDAVYVRSRRHQMIDAVNTRVARLGDQAAGRQFFDADQRFSNTGFVSGMGGGPKATISGQYTKTRFQSEVAATFEFANAQELYRDVACELPDNGAQAKPNKTDDAAQAADDGAVAAKLRMELAAADRSALGRMVCQASSSYANAYAAQLEAYYRSFVFDPGSSVALNFAVKPFGEANSWFTDFLLVVSRNLALEYPESDPGRYFESQRLALVQFEDLAKLLTEDGGQLPALEPYQAVITAMLKDLEAAVTDTGDPESPVLVGRLSNLGAFALGVETGVNQDYEELTRDWLYGATVEPDWFGPFLAPIQQVMRYGMLDVQAELDKAWKTDVRPLALPLLSRYPFNPTAVEDVNPDELEEVLRLQGEVPGSFWEAFDRLIRPAMREDKLAFVGGLRSYGGLIPMVSDLERLSELLWDEKGERIELVVDVQFGLLSAEPFERRVAVRSSISSGGGSVYGFNQRPQTQTLRYKWWEQGVSTVTLTLEYPAVEAKPEDNKLANYRISSDRQFSLFHLLDQARGISVSTRTNTLAQIAAYRWNGCGQRKPQHTRMTSVAWAVPVGRYGQQNIDVPVVIVNDPWEPFTIRRCF